MAKKTNQLTEADLAWFDLDRYRPDQLRALGAAGWTDALFRRLDIKEGMKAGASDYLLEDFENLCKNPVPSGPYYPERFFPSDRHTTEVGTMWLLSVSEIKNYAAKATESNLQEDELFTLAMRARNRTEAGNYALVGIDMAATREQLKEDFSLWLDRFDAQRDLRDKNYGAVPPRRFTTRTFEKWIKFQCLPCFDLDLYALSRNSTISPELLIDKLRPDEDADQPRTSDERDLVKTIRKITNAVTWDIVRALWRQQDEIAVDVSGEAQSDAQIDASEAVE